MPRVAANPRPAKLGCRHHRAAARRGRTRHCEHHQNSPHEVRQRGCPGEFQQGFSTAKSLIEAQQHLPARLGFEPFLDFLDRPRQFAARLLRLAVLKPEILLQLAVQINWQYLKLDRLQNYRLRSRLSRSSASICREAVEAGGSET